MVNNHLGQPRELVQAEPVTGAVRINNRKRTNL